MKRRNETTKRSPLLLTKKQRRQTKRPHHRNISIISKGCEEAVKEEGENRLFDS